MDRFKPDTAGDIQDIIGWAISHEKALCIEGAGSKSGLGRPVEADAVIELSALTGITLYEPGELILRAKAGTPLQEINDAVAHAGQQLAFEPPFWGPLYGVSHGGTLGGLIAANQSGSRRFKSGALRDHLLGVEAVSGRNDVFKSGGRVMKNVSGYDLPKLMAGSYGTLGVITEATLKVMPKPEKVQTLMIAGTTDRDASSLMTAATKSPLEVSGAAYLPGGVVAKSSLPEIAGVGNGITLLRLEGYADSIGARMDSLKSLVAAKGIDLDPIAGREGVAVLDDTTSDQLWADVSNAGFFAKDTSALWRVSSVPGRMNAIVASVGAEAWFADWAGGLIWFSVPAEGTADADIIRQAVSRGGGHATLMRAPNALRKRVPVFQPQDTVLAKLTANIKTAFDPHGVLNPGRMYADV